jgi:hypothetical protein
MARSLLAAVLLIASSLSATEPVFADFASRSRHLAGLFDDSNEPRKKLAEEEIATPYVPDGRMFATSFWVSPFLRMLYEPDVLGAAGVGADFLFKPNDYIGLLIGASSWWGEVEYYNGLGVEDAGTANEYTYPDYGYESVQIYEFELGFRIFPLHMRNSSLYVDIRAAYMISDGPDPILRTQSAGAGLYFGYEVGWRPFMFYLEGGMGFRKALFKNDAGWLGTPERNSGGGFMWDLLRVGFRFYL